MQQSTDGGYIILGHTGPHNAHGDLLLVKTDSNGNEIWSKTFGPTVFRWRGSVDQTTDGGYILAGGTDDIYLIKTNSNGEELWRNTLGGAGWEV